MANRRLICEVEIETCFDLKSRGAVLVLRTAPQGLQLGKVYRLAFAGETRAPVDVSYEAILLRTDVRYEVPCFLARGHSAADFGTGCTAGVFAQDEPPPP